MGRINASTGLVSGFPIVETVNQLVALQARPRDRLQQIVALEKQQQVAATQLTALLTSVQVAARTLGQDTTFEQRKVTSSLPDALSATATGTPALGLHQFTPLRKAQAQQMLSSGVASADDPLGGGTFTFRFGGFVDQAVDLGLLQGGSGFVPGRIRITDRAGNSADVDLRFARTVDDVLEAINQNPTLQVRAEVQGDRFKLVDLSGQTVSNLKVEELDGGTTAQSLGLAGIDVAADEALGQDVLRLDPTLRLEQLNDALGVDIDDALADLQIEFRDGTSVQVDLRPINNVSLHAQGTTNAAGGLDAQVLVSALNSGPGYEGVTVQFVDDPNVTAGNELVSYDSNTKVLEVKIDAGNTTAQQVVDAINGDPAVSTLFTAALPEGSSGTGLVDVADTATLELPDEVPYERTLGDVLESIERAAPGKIKAEISADGDRIVLTDLSTDLGNPFKVSALFDSPVAEQLGLAGQSTTGTLQSRRLLGGLKTSLVSTLNGGQGFTLGQISLTDRAGNSATVDLSSAETFEDILNVINAAGVGIRAELNPARNGIRLVDTTGSTSGPLVVANADATNTAQLLGIEINANQSEVDGGSLNRQLISRSTPLAELNGGRGVTLGKIRVFNSQGSGYSVDLNKPNIQTVGDVLDRISLLVPGVEARINDTGDGIVLVDTLGGNSTLRVLEQGSSTARDLRILGEGTTQVVNGQTEQRIDGRQTFIIQLDPDDSLRDLVHKINELDAGVSASVFNTGGSVNPYKLSLNSLQTGRRGELLVDTRQAPLQMFTTARAQDAVLVLGDYSPTGAAPFVTSADNTFDEVIDGVRLELNQATTAPVTVSVEPSDAVLVTAVESLVENYNQFRKKLQEVTAFDPETGQRGLLFADGAVLRLDSELLQFFSGRFLGAGPIESLESLGISLKDDGTLELDKSKLQAKVAEDPEAVRSFFADEENGFSKRLDQLLEQLIGADNSLMSNRIQTFQRRIESRESRIEFLNQRLERLRQRLLRQFIRMEESIAEMQSNLQFIQSIVPITPLAGGGSVIPGL